MAGAGHMLFLLAYLLPWVTGALGRHESLSGLRLAGVAVDAAALDGAPLTFAAVGGLFASPALAAGALALLLARRRLGVDVRAALGLSAAVAVVPLATVAATMAGVPLGWWDERITGVAPGLALALGAAAIALGASTAGMLRAVPRVGPAGWAGDGVRCNERGSS